MRIIRSTTARRIRWDIPSATVLFVTALFVACAPAPQAPPESPYARVETILEQARKDFQSPGLSAAVAVDDKLVWSRGFGLADIENDVPASAESVYRIGSVSKPISAVAVMQFIEQGAVSLDEPIQKYVPDFPEKRPHEITLRHLLTHTSGIRHYADGEFDNPVHYASVADALKIFRDDPLEFPPGEKYQYSSYAYNLLAAVVENVSAQSFEDYLNAQVFGPAGMTSTFLEFRERIVPHRVRPYAKGDKEPLNAPLADLSVKWAGGGMISTAPDLVRFHIALNEGKLLKPETLEQMYQPAVETGNGHYGLGWRIFERTEGGPWLGHTGGSTGGSSVLVRNPSKKLAVAILVNVQNAGDLAGLGLRVADEVLKNAGATQ